MSDDPKVVSLVAKLSERAREQEEEQFNARLDLIRDLDPGSPPGQFTR